MKNLKLAALGADKKRTIVKVGNVKIGECFTNY
jgi:hypothetical protein